MDRKFISRLLACVVLFYVCTIALSAQCPQDVVAVGLQAPTKIISAAGNLLIAEAGFGFNQGRISVLNPANGQVWTLVDGMPSAFSPPNGDPTGPSGLALLGNMLYVSIGLGDAIIGGVVPNTQLPNPTPSSPLFSSVLAIDLGPQGKGFRGGFSLSAANQTSIANGRSVRLQNASGDSVVVRLVANFPNYVSEPVPGEPNNVRQSNPYGLVAIDNYLYVPDASSNNVRVVNLTSGSFQTLTTFAPLPNLAAFGPPVVEAVPNNIRRFGDGLLVTLFSGFPFAPAGAQVVAVSPSTGAQTTLLPGLNSAIDVLPVKSKSNSALVTLEFSTNLLGNELGRLSLYSSPTATPQVLSSCLVTPTAMAQDKSGQIYVVEIFTGRVMRIKLP